MTVTEERTRLEAPAEHGHRVRWRLVAVIGVVALVGGLLLGIFRGRSDSGEEFDFSTDSVCEWFSAEDMNQIVAAAQDRVGTELGSAPFRDGDCDQGDVGVWPSPPSGDSKVIVVLATAASGADAGGRRTTEPDDFVGHELLDDAVTYGNFATTAWYMPGMATDLRVEGHEDDVLWFAFLLPGTSGPGPSEVQHEMLGLAVADAMLRDMNWID